MSKNRAVLLAGVFGAAIGTPIGLLLTAFLAWLIGRKSVATSQVATTAPRDAALHLVPDGQSGSAS